MAGIWCGEGRLGRRWVWREGPLTGLSWVKISIEHWPWINPFPPLSIKMAPGKENSRWFPEDPERCISVCTWRIAHVTPHGWSAFLALAPTKMSAPGGQGLCPLHFHLPHTWLRAGILGWMHIYILICMCPHFCLWEACARGMSLGEHTYIPPHRVHVCMLKAQWAVCVLVSLTVWALSAGWHTCVCGCENTRVLRPLPHQFLHPLHLWSQRFFFSQVGGVINGDKVKTWQIL